MDDESRDGTDLRSRVAAIMNNAWREPGFCVPNGHTYPHQWLWDSCFHAVVWCALDDDRGVTELEQALAKQDPTGFVPHLTYWHHPDRHRAFWGRSMTSIITQPPMYGHAARQLVDNGHRLADDLVESMGRGLLWLFRDRARTPAGLIPVLHPWESGCDDSPRWDDYRNPGVSWRDVKGDLVAALREADDSDVSLPFRVGSVGFNALVAWNALEYLTIDGAPYRAEIDDAAAALIEVLRSRWDAASLTWVDDGPASGRIRTLDALLVVLVDPRAQVFEQLVDPAAFGARYGPRGVHVDEPTYRPDVYWRGPAWPQLSYLAWVAAERAGRPDVAAVLARSLVDGAAASGFAEYWHPETGQGLGAIPQTWAALAYVVARADGGRPRLPGSHDAEQGRED